MASESPDKQLTKMRHSAAHLLAAAILELRPDAKPSIGPAIENGFYYDFDFGNTPLSEEALPAIEEKMRELLPQWTNFSHREISAEDARELFADNPYKLELIDEIVGKDETITLYTAGELTDLCRGGHVDNPSEELGAFKLLSLAGAYWRGDESKPMLTRIYGLLFPTDDELKAHLTMLEEAKARDHRTLGQELDLFTFSPLVGPGLPLFTPRGTAIRRELQGFLDELQVPRGYAPVVIPHLAKAALYKTSGHWDKFKDNLFHVRGRGVDTFVLKPMNCPHHTQIYAAQLRSYRDLPLRFMESTAVYRDEQAGELLGLTRVRSITQDDAHVFCRPDQIEHEVAMILEIIQQFYAAFDFSLAVHLSVRDPKTPDIYLGDDAVWQTAEDSLAAALDMAGLMYVRDEGEAAFYGPKIDFIATDALARRWQLATVQLDFVMPQRFALSYIDENGTKQVPVMIHRAILGSFERFLAVLLEHFAGRLPLWLSPVQAAVLPISDEQVLFASQVVGDLLAAGVRAEIDDRAGSVGKKIRHAESMRVPVILVVGKREAAEGSVSVRSMGKDHGVRTIAVAVKEISAAAAERRVAAF
ncbi:MAG: threonine--tRNA ligase [Candidatus Andersenbacteria bacterium CG10_big_fil_rev_8_21_14_0_10_54_11]|uniref:Threonine--tRNA ligase n=1 Tax=Candidatus Andersenbacteria bacterium CG10_big_fil_rev_8_21_14_0_10_54_11 TaxID=1974485 RepID=A0A2M6WYZ4_9BACT|nr:MAG: threonine--tRNA ligase [Candidatus Andersenbacteria bacterium CG10_big_fil_rev_8_21_14_0_10_54_11]